MVGCDPIASHTGSSRVPPRAGTAHRGGSIIGRCEVCLEPVKLSSFEVMVSKEFVLEKSDSPEESTVGELFLQR